MRKLSTLLVLTLIATGAFAEKVAVMSKVSGDVLLQKADASGFNEAATRGAILENNDRVRVNNGFAVLLLLDDQSQFKLRENTEVAITMVEDLSGRDYHMRLDYGQTLTKFVTDERSGFNIHTPTSVVSVKGTQFWTISDPEAGDNVIVLEGDVSVMNNLTGSTSRATAGQSIRSTLDGNVESAPTDEGSIPEDPDPDDGFGAIESEQETPDAPVTVETADTEKTDAGAGKEEVKHTKRDLGLILGLVVLVLFAALL